MFNNMKLATKIMLAMLVTIAGMLVISTSTYFGLSKIGAELEEIAEYQIPMNKVIVELEKDILKEEILTYELIIEGVNPNSSKYKKLREKLKETEKKTTKLIKKAEEVVKGAIDHVEDEKIKSIYKKMYVKLTKIEKEQVLIKKDIYKLISYIQEQDTQNINKEKNILQKELGKIEEDVQSLTKELLNLLEKSALTAEEHEVSILKTIEIISALVILLAIIITVLLSRYIKTTIEKFETGLFSFFSFLNKETNTVNPLEIDSNDELGKMAKVVNQNIEKIEFSINDDRRFLEEVHLMVEEVKKGYVFKRFKTPVQSENLEELRKSLNEMLEILNRNICGSTNKLFNVLCSYSRLDFRDKVHSDTGKIAQALNEVSELITQMLVENKKNGLTLENSAQILLNNVDTLNVSSTEAAASLEETAAALEEITGNVSTTTHKISQMSSLAKEVTKSTDAGRELASRTTKSMDEINEEVTAINEAITVIDQIAFQTNILSLNAAVEAATAGEAGKGFAVVAQEVRNLANKSAEAAKDIKDLVESATAKANDGKVISDEMIAGYEDLNKNINETLHLIDDVELAAREQKAGIDQINDAVNMLDQKTQQNAIVANQTHEIALGTNYVAQKIVYNADQKEFDGKNEVNPESIEELLAKKTKVLIQKKMIAQKVKIVLLMLVKSLLKTKAHGQVTKSKDNSLDFIFFLNFFL